MSAGAVEAEQQVGQFADLRDRGVEAKPLDRVADPEDGLVAGPPGLLGSRRFPMRSLLRDQTSKRSLDHWRPSVFV